MEHRRRCGRERCSPATTLQTCIVHLIRNCLEFAGWKDRRLLAARSSRTTPHRLPRPLRSLAASRPAPGPLKFPIVAAARRRAWYRVIPLFALPPAVRKVIYTTNALESINGEVA